MKFVRLFMLPAICVLVGVTTSAQTKCCDRTPCRDSAMVLVADFAGTVRDLGPVPYTQAAKEKFADSLSNFHPEKFNKIREVALRNKAWYANDAGRRECIVQQYETLDENTLNWMQYFLSIFFSSSFRSPEFVKGWGMQIHVNMGALNPLRTTERFVSTGGVLLSYTFGSKDQVAGGRFRLLAGPSFYYSQKITYLMANARAEIRLGDLGGGEFNAGCFKLMVDGNFHGKVTMAGLGLAVELARIGIQLKGDYEFKNDAFLAQLGLAYIISFNKNK